MTPQTNTPQDGGDELRAAFNILQMVLQMDLHAELWPNSEAQLIDSFAKFEASVMQLIQAREREAEKRGRDNIIMELVQGWSGLAEDIATIHKGAESLSRKSQALVTRLSVLDPKPQAGDKK